MAEAADKVIAQGKAVAAALLGVAVDDVSFEDGLFQSVQNTTQKDSLPE